LQISLIWNQVCTFLLFIFIGELASGNGLGCFFYETKRHMLDIYMEIWSQPMESRVFGVKTWSFHEGWNVLMVFYFWFKDVRLIFLEWIFQYKDFKAIGELLMLKKNSTWKKKYGGFNENEGLNTRTKHPKVERLKVFNLKFKRLCQHLTIIK
jgi:hypothetical protein